LLLHLALLFCGTAASAAASRPPCLLAIGILSRSSNSDNRQLIRDTWFNSPHLIGRHAVAAARFFVATPEDEESGEALKKEADKFGDIIRVPVVEHYKNLSWQTLDVLRFWTAAAIGGPAQSAFAHWSQLPEQRCSYIMKTDDDVFPNLPTLMPYIAKMHNDRWGAAVTQSHEYIYAGHITYSSEPHRRGRWAVTTTEYPEEKFPPWAGGPSYLLSSRLAEEIAREHARLRGNWSLGGPHTIAESAAAGRGTKGGVAQAEGLRMLSVEDVSVALWVEHLQRYRQIQVKMVNERRFLRLRFCLDGAFSVLVEGGRQWENRSDAYLQLWLNQEERRKHKQAQRGPMFCPGGGLPVDYELKQSLIRVAEEQARLETGYPVKGVGSEGSKEELEEAEEDARSKRAEWADQYAKGVLPRQRRRAEKILVERLELEVMRLVKRGRRKQGRAGNKAAALSAAENLQTLADALASDFRTDSGNAEL
jgi:hypothetical protein